MAARVPLSQFDIDLIQAQAERLSTDDEDSSCYLVGLSVSQGAPTGIAVLQKVKPPARRGDRAEASNGGPSLGKKKIAAILARAGLDQKECRDKPRG
jgi:hypothetical protein